MGDLTAAAGWYANPEQHGQERYWDGFAWTDQVRAPTPWEPPTSERDQERLAYTIQAHRRATLRGDPTPDLAEFGIRSALAHEQACNWHDGVYWPAYEEKLRNTPWSEMLKETLQSIEWRFSLYGVVVLLLGLFTLFVGTAIVGWLGIPVGLGLLVFAAYVFGGGRARFWIF